MDGPIGIHFRSIWRELKYAFDDLQSTEVSIVHAKLLYFHSSLFSDHFGLFDAVQKVIQFKYLEDFKFWTL